MVSNLAIKNSFSEVELTELQQDDVKWCTVSLSDILKIGKRLEASLFDVESKKAYQILNECKYERINLICKQGFVSSAHYGGRLKRNYINSNDDTAIGFIGSSEMLDINPKPTKFMSTKITAIDSLRVKKGTVLISRSGTIGNLTLVNDTLSKLLVSEHAIRLECDKYEGYVYCFLKTKTGQAVINSKIYGAVIQQIEPEHLADIPVPNPPDTIKAKINSLITDSFELRDKSNELIDQANILLINELKLPPLCKFEKECFDSTRDIDNYTVKLSQLSGRLDGSYHVPIVKAITEHLKIHSAEVTNIGDKRISQEIILPGRFKRVYVEEGKGRVFFGGKQMFQLDSTNEKYLSLAHHGDRIRKELEISENTVLITRSGTIGKVVLTPKHWEHSIASEHIIRVVPDSNDIAGYLSIFLSSVYGHALITRYTYGSVVDEIDDRHVAEIPFPLLKNKAIQNEINEFALQANRLRNEAYQAEQKALRIMNDEVIYAK